MPQIPGEGRPERERFTVFDLGEPIDLTDEQRSWRMVEPEINSGERFTVFDLGEPLPTMSDGPLLSALVGLPKADRRVFALYFLDGLSDREVARRLGVPVAVVRSSVKRSGDVLRAALMT